LQNTTTVMANFLNIENLTKSYGDRLLFGDITFGVDEGDKIGIVARNGTGKSTLLRILAGQESADSGNVVFRNGIRIGYLPQEPAFRPGATVIEAAIDSDDPMAAVVRRYSEAVASGDPRAGEEVVHEMDAAGAWNYEDRLRQLLTRFGLDDFSASVDKLSGGQRKRLAIARTIMAEPDFLILDEPTNHLDISTIEWLETYLKRSRATLLMVTHDRYFLDRVCSKIIEIDDCSVFEVEGNYDMYLRRRSERIEAMTAEVARVRNTLRREQEWMSRQPQARAGKAKFRIDNFYDLKERSKKTHIEHNVRLDAESSRVGSKIFEAEHISKRFVDKVILDYFTYTFAPGEKLGIVGVNGVGKSTFIKMLQGIVRQDSGEWNVGDTVRFGYYSQDGIQFNGQEKVVDAVSRLADDIRLEEGNVLLLDEPTNDLDIITLGILEEYLAEFKGCVIVVSHDRFFLDNIVDHLFVMEGGGVVKDFPGNYTDYRAYLDTVAKDEPKKPESRAKEEPERRRAERPVKLSFKERKELEAIESELQALNEERTSLEAFFASGENCAPDEFAARSQRYAALGDIIDEKEMRWLELSEKS